MGLGLRLVPGLWTNLVSGGAKVIGKAAQIAVEAVGTVIGGAGQGARKLAAGVISGAGSVAEGNSSRGAK